MNFDYPDMTIDSIKKRKGRVYSLKFLCPPNGTLKRWGLTYDEVVEEICYHKKLCGNGMFGFKITHSFECDTDIIVAEVPIMKKWYVIEAFAELDDSTVVELTDEEYALLKDIFKQAGTNTIINEDYSAEVELVDHAFNTRDEAEAYAKSVGRHKERYNRIEMFK